MLVSIIIPTYNRAETIEQAVDSALAQTWPSTEIIVVDDGSVDQTRNILEKYGDRIRFLQQKNQGPSAARNTGIRAATGEIVAFLDSDDTWLPNKIGRQVQLLQRTYDAGVRCCLTNTRMVYADGRFDTSFAISSLQPNRPEGIWTNPTDILVTRFLMFNQAVAVWRQTLEEVGGFREDFRILEDYDLALRLSLTGPWAFIAEPLVIWNGGTENSLTKAASELAASSRSYEILKGLSVSPRWGSTMPQHLLNLQLNYLSKHIAANRLRSHQEIGHRLYANCMLKFLKLSRAIYRRLPIFPRMITRPA